MPLWVGLGTRVPFDLLAEQDFAVHERRDLAIAGAQVEADPAAVEMPAKRSHGGFPLGQFVAFHAHDLEGMAVDFVAHNVGVEAAGRRVAIVRLEPVHEALRPGDVNAPRAARPEQEFDEAFDVDGIGGQVVVVVRQRLGDRAVDRAVGLFESDADVGCRARFIAGAQKSAIGQDSGLESRVENG